MSRAKVGSFPSMRSLLFTAILASCGLAQAANNIGSNHHAMTPEIKLVDDYNAWYLGGAKDNPEELKKGLAKYITKDTVLHEVESLPWGGTWVGFDGWLREAKAADSPALVKAYSNLELSQPRYYQDGNIVFHELTVTIKGTEAVPQPFTMFVIEKYTIEQGRIARMEEFYADTAGFVDRLAALGAMPSRK